MKLALIIIVWASTCSAALAGQTRRYFNYGPAPQVVYFLDLTPQPMITRGTICNLPPWQPMSVPFRTGPTNHVSRTYRGDWSSAGGVHATHADTNGSRPQLIINPYVKQE